MRKEVMKKQKGKEKYKQKKRKKKKKMKDNSNIYLKLLKRLQSGHSDKVLLFIIHSGYTI